MKNMVNIYLIDFFMEGIINFYMGYHYHQYPLFQRILTLFAHAFRILQ